MATEGTGAVHARGLGPDGSGRGWKVSPSIRIEPGETRVLADIAARIEIENTDPDNHGIICYQINYTLTEVPEDAAYFTPS